MASWSLIPSIGIHDLSALEALLAFWSEWQVVGVMIYGANDDQRTADPSIGVRKA